MPAPSVEHTLSSEALTGVYGGKGHEESRPFPLRPFEFTTLSAILGYLHATLNGLLTDTLRFHLCGRTREAPLPASGCFEEPAAPDCLDGQSNWESIASLLPDERERRLAYLLYHCGLKPREIVQRCPQEFADVKEIYRLNVNLIGRLRRNRDRLRHVLDNDE